MNIIKVFITNEVFQIMRDIGNSCCLYGLKENNEAKYFVTNYQKTIHCDHQKCLKLIFSENNELVSLPKEPNQYIIILFDESDILNLELTQKIVLKDYGKDFLYLVENVKSFNEFKDNSAEEASELKSENMSWWYKILNNSNLYKYFTNKYCLIESKSFLEVLSLGIIDMMIALFIIILMQYSVKNCSWYDIDSKIQIVIKETVVKLDNLIKYLMGAPVGLKLNKPLTNIFGKFYLFHLSIWENYMNSFILPLLWVTMPICKYLIPLGASFLLCALMDLMILVTLHLNCFYVYSCRLYRLEIISISSLIRLFHGRKYNPLRNRVDSSPSQIDRMFVSTLILTSALFLMPTIIVFYSVFGVIHLIAITFENSIKTFISFLFDFPCYSLVTWILRKNRHKKKLFLERFAETNNGLILKANFSMEPISNIFIESRSSDNLMGVKSTFSTIILNFISGHSI